MPGMLTFKELQQAVGAGEIDTVIACFPDMQGRLVGKRFQAEYFLDGAYQETHGCDYLLANDIDMEPVPGYAVANWEKGYGDFIMKPDMATLRRIPWLPGTALVLCDILDHHSHEDLAHAPRAMLRKQIARLDGHGHVVLLRLGARVLSVRRDLRVGAKPKAFAISRPPAAISRTTTSSRPPRRKSVMRAIRKGLQGAGIPVENSKGEWGPGQEELNVRYADPLSMADWHVILKNGCKEIAHGLGKAVTFMAKWRYDLAGSSSHIHVSLWDEPGKTPLFLDAKGEHGMSPLMRQFVAGQLAYAREITWFLAPYINSYKRFQVGTFAPTRAIWSLDNRTAGFRLCGADTKAIRIECRIGGADLNPYLAFSALIAAGLAGIEQKLDLEPAYVGDAYQDKTLREVPKTLREATESDARLENAARRFRRRGHRPLCSQCGMGAVRV